jgi:membrane protease YdiL (CAAX protease family)
MGLALPLLPVSRTAYLGFVFTLGVAVWLVFRGENLGNYGVKAPDNWLRAMAVWLGTVLACLAYSAVLEPILDPLLGPDKAVSLFSEVRGNTVLYLTVLPAIWLFAGVGEEFLYRGFILNRALAVYARFRLGWLFAISTQAALFGIAHLYQGPSGMLGAFVYGLFFGLAFKVAKGTLLPGILAHGTIDTLGFTLLYLGKIH